MQLKIKDKTTVLNASKQELFLVTIRYIFIVNDFKFITTYSILS